MQHTAFRKIDTALNNREDVLIMCVGDSITWGCNHCNVNETYCAYLADAFAKLYKDVTVLRFDGVMTQSGMPLERYDGPTIVQSGEKSTLTLVKSGVGGDTVKRAIARADDFIGAFQEGKEPDVFLLMFGINDALDDPQKFVTPEEYYANYTILYDRIRKAHPQAAVVLMTPTYNDSGKSHTSCLDAYADMVKLLAEKTGSQLIDLHRVFMEHLVIGAEHYGQGDWLSGKVGDYCHLSPRGSAAVAKHIFDAL